MIRQPGGEECKLCTRPFTVYRWNAQKEQRKLKKTVVCKTCAQARNCCQSCMVDVIYRIPLEIRDAALKMAGIPNEYAVESSRNREVKAIMADKLEAKGPIATSDTDNTAKAKAILQALSTKLAQKPTTSEKLQDMNNKEISKVVAKLPFGGNLAVPGDSSIKSFFVFGFPPEMPQYALTSHFEKAGQVSQCKVIHKARCGFVSFLTRRIAEDFAKSVSTNGFSKPKTAGLVIIDNKYPVRITWGSPRPLGTSDEHSKIGLVVMKVMKQLADKDANKPKETTPKVYNSASKDVEL